MNFTKNLMQKFCNELGAKGKFMFALLALTFISLASNAQNRTITGKVVDEKTGAGLPSANVGAKGTTTTVKTSADGSFSISVGASVKELVISNAGFTTKNVAIDGNNVGTITLEVSIRPEDAVIVTGYTKVKRTEYSGAVSTVLSKDIRAVPVGSFDQILQGRAAGLSVLSGSGQPGNSAAVVLRGPTSINSGIGPLYILDGIPVEAGVFQSINPNNFESVDVLKDGISAAIYGSRGAAGVIVATTKKGNSGKLKVNFLYQTGRKFKPQFNYDMMNSRELLKAQEQVGLFTPTSTAPGWVNSPLNPTFASQTPAVQAQRLRTIDSLGGINNNWDDNFFRDGRFSSYDLGLTAGTGKTRLYSNISMYKEEGLIRRSDMKRINMQNNLDFGGADDKLNVSVSSLIGYTKRNFQQNTTSNSVFNPFLSSRITVPYFTPKLPNGAVNFNGTALGAYGPYLIDAMEKDQIYNDQIKVTLGTTANYKLFDFLSLNASGGVDFRETQNTNFANPLTITNTPLINSNVRTQGGSFTEGLTRFLSLNARAGATFAKVFKEKHSVSVTSLYEVVQRFNKSLSQTGFNLDRRRPGTFAATLPVNTGNAVDFFPNVSGGRTRNAVQSVANLLKYAFNDKYVLNAAYRIDGSSKLPEANRWQSFVGIGGTWNIDKEKFIQKSKFINTLRLKVSYGEAANEENFGFGNFGFLDQYGTGIYIGGPAGNNQTLSVGTPGNPNLDWEYTSTTNVGIDFGFFKSRLYGDIQLYNKITRGLVVSQTLSATAGFGTGFGYDVNAGRMGNKGIEYNINVDIISKKDFRWTIGANGAYNKNEVLDLGQVANFERGTERIEVGKPLGSHFNVGWGGVDAATGSPLYLDLNGAVTNSFSAANRTTNWGTYFAPYTGGITTNLSYKGFDISALFNWQKGSTRLNNLEFFVENPAFLQQGFNQARSLDFWKKPGDQTRVQSPLFQNQFSSKYLQDASFMRFRNLTVSYTLPKTVTNRLKVSNIRAFVQGQNLAVWTRWKGYDPEDDNNISLSEFPNPRAITAGIDITF